MKNVIMMITRDVSELSLAQIWLGFSSVWSWTTKFTWTVDSFENFENAVF